MFLLGKISASELFFYIISQFAAALISAFLSYLTGGDLNVLKPSVNVSYLHAVVFELLFTFLLLFTILMLCVSGLTQGNHYFGFAIGLAVFAGISVAGPVSGGSMNPAVATAMILSDLLNGGNTLKYIWIYSAGPVTGGLLALYVYRFLHKYQNT
jgi:glycerol uptake facilitator-like aquaporin